MTPGDVITVKGTDLVEDERYYVYFENESGGLFSTLLDDAKADEKGEVEIEVNVPYRDELRDYEIGLYNGTDDLFGSATVWVNNTYKVKYKSGGEYLGQLRRPYRDTARE